MSSRRRTKRIARPPTIPQVNQRCKQFMARQCFMCMAAISLMTYFVSYEHPNIKSRPKLLNESDLVIMSFNVRGSNLDSGATTAWQSRKKVVADMLNLYSPDIIGLQEPQTNQIETFEQHGYNASGKFIATSILYNTETLTLVDGDTVWLSETPQIEHSKSWDMSQERVVTWILVTNKNKNTQQCSENDENSQQCPAQETKQGYLIFNTHLDHRGEKSRVESCIVIKDKIDEISRVKYENEYAVFITGDFNAAKYGNVWNCFTENDDDSFELKDALHDSYRFSYRKDLQLQYTYHGFRGLQMNTWYMRMTQYFFFGFSNSVVKFFRDTFFNGVCCMAPSMYRQIYRRRKFDRRAGLHHVDWILYDKNDKIDEVKYFEVVSYHRMVESDKQSAIKWSFSGLFRDRYVEKTIFPSDHFPVIAGFTLK